MNPDAPPPPLPALPPLPGVPNVPPVPPVIGVIPVAEEASVVHVDVEEWYTNKVGGMRLGGHELAANLVRGTKDVAVATALSELVAVQAGIVSGVTAPRRMNETTQSTFPKYFLTVKDDTVQVVYGVKWCVYADPVNPSLVGLMGDKYHVGQAIRDPSVMSLPGTSQVQTNHFGGVVRIRAKDLDEIITELGDAGNVVLMPMIVRASLRFSNGAPVATSLFTLKICFNVLVNIAFGNN